VELIDPDDRKISDLVALLLNPKGNSFASGKIPGKITGPDKEFSDGKPGANRWDHL